MTRDQLEHLIRAAGAIAGVTRLIIVGSQAILGKYPQPADIALMKSMEADLYPPDNPELAEVIEGSIGQDSSFHATFGYYADGVGPETAILPTGWGDRLVEIKNENTGGVTGLCLEPNDLAVSKLVAGREKDLRFVEALLSCGYITISILRERVDSIAAAETVMAKLLAAQIDNIELKQSRHHKPNGGFGGGFPTAN